MSQLLILYFGIIVITAISINGNIYSYMPCEICLINKDTNYRYYFKNKKFCDGCIPHYYKFDFNTTKELMELLMEHEKNYNNPCTDFYEHICGHWNIANSMFETKWSIQSFNEYKVYYYYLQSLLKGKQYDTKEKSKKKHKEKKYENYPFVKLARKLYSSCIDIDARETKGLEPMQQMLNATGGWPILMSEKERSVRNYTWQQVDNDYFKLYGFFILFDISYSNDGKNPGIFKINPSLQYPLNNKLKIDIKQLPYDVYMNAIKWVVRTFAKDKGIKIPTELLRKSLIELITFEKNLKNLVKYDKKKTVGEKMTIMELQEYYNKEGRYHTARINWLEKIRIVSKLLDINIDAFETILVFNKEILRDLAYLLKTTPQHTIVNYLQWHVMSIFLNNLNTQTRAFVLKYNYPRKIKINDYALQEQQWFVCIEEFLMKDALSYLFVKEYNILSNYKKHVLDIFENIKKEIIDYIKSLTWLNTHTEGFLTHMIYKMSFNIIGSVNSEWYDNETALTQLYKELKIDDNYFTNVLAIIKYQNIRKQRNEAEYRDENLYRWPFNFLSDNPRYDIQSNTIYLPVAALDYPYLDLKESHVVNYSGLGMIIGKLMARYINFYLGSYLDDNGNIKLNTEIRETYETRSQCLFMSMLNSIEQYHNSQFNFTNKIPENIQSYKNFIEKESIPHFIATEIVLAALQRKNFTLPTLRHDYYQSYRTTAEHSTDSQSKDFLKKEQLFFVYQTSIQCGMLERHEKNFINGILANMESFSQAFNCPVGSPMNPTFKCKNWQEATIE